MVLGIVAAGAFLAHKAMHPITPQTVAETAAPASTAMSAASTAIQHPIEQAQAEPATASTAALPTLDNSDTSVASALAALAGGSDLSTLLVRQQIIARIVATVDALPRRGGLSTYMLPVHTPKGAFITEDSNGTTLTGEQNAERYASYMQVVEGTDPQALVAWYVHSYPLFQEAYRQLGYPKGYFNDRLIVVIDDMLTAPEPVQPPALVHSKAYYVYADPALESLSTGQKLLIRVGAVNEAKIKTRLRAIRARLVGQTLPAASASTE